MYIYIYVVLQYMLRSFIGNEVRNQLLFSLELLPSWTSKQTNLLEGIQTNEKRQGVVFKEEVASLNLYSCKMNLEVKVVNLMDS